MDIREAILVRLTDIAGEIDGVVTHARNKLEISDNRCPAIIVWDSDESAVDTDPTPRPSNSPRKVDMTPEIHIHVNGPEETVGTELNAFRAKVIKAVTTDAGLVALTSGRREQIRYLGLGTGLGAGREIIAAMILRFSIPYILQPDQL